MAAKNGGPAFPVSYISDGNPGMTLRDYFAGQALAGMLSASLELSPDQMERIEALGGTRPAMAQACYRIADAMLAAREEVES